MPPYHKLSVHRLQCVLSINAYLKDSPNPCLRQPDVDWVNVGDHVSYSLELIQKLHDLVHLVEEVHLAAFVVPRPSLVHAELLELTCTAKYFVKCSVDADGVCRQQQSTDRLSIIAFESFESVREYAASIRRMRRALWWCRS